MDPINSKSLPARMMPIAISVILITVFILFIPAPSGGDASFYSIALSRFSSEEAAKKEEAKLKNSGNNAFYRKEKNTESGKIEYQVYIERFNSEEEAIKEARVLKDLELISDYIVKEVADTPVIEEPLSEPPLQVTEISKVTGENSAVHDTSSVVPKNEPPPPEINVNEAAAEKTNPDTAKHAPDIKKAETEKIPSTDEIIDQPKGATLQVGAYKEEANAAILKKQLISLGRTAFYRRENAEGLGDLYRIYITGYKTLGEAVKDAKTLVESGVITGYARSQNKFTVADIPTEKIYAVQNEPGGSIFFIHTGSFKEEVNAQRVVASLKESGYKAFYVPEKEPSVTWFRVYIGDFKSEAQAREKGMELLEKGIITYFKPVAIMPQEKGN
jgi:cell division septation protein DedD